MMGQFEIPYEMKDLVVDKEGIKLLEPVNPRAIRGSQVLRIYRCLLDGKHFDTPFVVNVRDSEKVIRVIDGSHRTEAMKRLFETQPKWTIKVKMAVYKNLNEMQEREVYTKWNLGVKQSADDFINSYKAEISIFPYMLSVIPVAIYGGKNKYHFRYLIDAYFSSKQRPFIGGVNYSRVQFIDKIKELNDIDVDNILDTLNIFEEIFNPTNIVDFMRLSAFKLVNFKAIFSLIHFNKTVLGHSYVKKRMTTVLYKSIAVEESRHYSRQNCIEVFEHFKSMLNKKAVKQFI